MKTPVQKSRPLPDSGKEAQIVGKAAIRAAALLDLSNVELARILGLSEPTISRLKNGGFTLDPASKAFELAQLFLRLFRGLDSITGADATSKAWLRNENLALRGRPIDLIKTVTGLTQTVMYVDARRAPL